MARKFKRAGRFRKKIRRRRFHRKRRHHAKLNTKQLGMGVPDRIRLKMRYADENQIGGFAGTYVWKVNSLYDPDSSGTGHQPMYYDQYKALYQRYSVFGCKVDVKIVNDGTTSIYGSLVFSDLDVSGYAPITAGELKHSKRFVVGNGNANNVKTVSMYMPMSKMFGIQNIAAYDANIASSGQDPANVVYAFIKLASVDNITSMKAFIWTRLTYYCTMFDYYDQNPSFFTHNYSGPTGATGSSSELVPPGPTGY